MTAAAVAVPGGVLVATANVQLREQLIRRFESCRTPVQTAGGGAEAFAKLEGGCWQMLVLDRQLPDLNAEELVELTKRRYPAIEVLVVDSTADHAAAASSPHLVRASAIRGRFDQKPGSDEPLPGMIGDSEPMQRMYRMVRLVARRNTTVLVTGPSGSGKELVARAVHSLSARSGGSFSVLNCAAIPETLIESELFGYARGAFTGAAQTYAGRILAAQGGTLFLDEIGELPLNAQAKLLRFLEYKEVQRLGSAETCKVDVRVVAATNRDLPELVKHGQFRDDLYFRLCAFPIGLAPLAERGRDISALATHFLERLSEPPLRLDAHALRLLETYEWPGNVRELQQVLERAAIIAEEVTTILAEHIVFGFQKDAAIGEKVAC